MKKGKLIVIEGSDGAGKTTQITLLEEYFRKNQIQFKIHDFPQYETSFFGKFIGQFLNGEFGSVENVPPYFVSFPFAADRFLAKDMLQKELNEGNIILLDRYVGSNAAFQGARILDVKKREEFIKWLFKMEYEILKVSKEDLIIFLYVPVDIAQKLIMIREKKDYLSKGKKRDIYEKDVEFQKRTSKIYQEFCRKYKNWVLINCTKDGKILSREEIHAKVIKVCSGLFH
ncbi:dTMP kinase [Candidatus Gottesmanbacteria bacterium]|nr:dTMP kinase [Candidatus Gottesmanbacteria bacterium]